MSRGPYAQDRRSVQPVTTSETPDTGYIDAGYLPAMLNPFEPGFFDNPYAQYALVREQDPVHMSPIGMLGALPLRRRVPRAARPEPQRRDSATRSRSPSRWTPTSRRCSRSVARAARTRCSTSTRPIITGCGGSCRRCSRRAPSRSCTRACSSSSTSISTRSRRAAPARWTSSPISRSRSRSS